MIILGIDPGTATTGYGVIKVKIPKRKKQKIKNKNLKCLRFGCIKTSPIDNFPKRLLVLSQEIKKLVKTYQPQLVAIESLFFFKNEKTIIKVSQATGAIILTLGKLKTPIVQYPPLQVKKFLTKNGKAQKEEIQKKVQRIFKLKKKLMKEKLIKDDAADALAIAIYAAHKII